MDGGAILCNDRNSQMAVVKQHAVQLVPHTWWPSNPTLGGYQGVRRARPRDTQRACTALPCAALRWAGLRRCSVARGSPQGLEGHPQWCWPESERTRGGEGRGGEGRRKIEMTRPSLEKAREPSDMPCAATAAQRGSSFRHRSTVLACARCMQLALGSSSES